MARILPEKTVELWTALSLVEALGDDTWIWSRTVGIDQDFWTANLKKWFVLELKSPESAPDPYFQIDLDQLHRYVTGFNNRNHPDVLYVLPDPLANQAWPLITAITPIPPAPASPSVRRGFPTWTYVVRATDLSRILGRTTGTARLRCNTANTHIPTPAVGRWAPPTPPADTLEDFLAQVLRCTEPPGIALRSTETTKANDQYSDWELNAERLFRALESLSAVRSSSRRFIAL